MLLENKTRINDEWVVYPDGKKVYLHTQKAPLNYNDRGDIGILGIK